MAEIPKADDDRGDITERLVSRSLEAGGKAAHRVRLIATVLALAAAAAGLVG